MSDDATPAGRWMIDPTGQHELRWHDGAAFTGYVSDDGRQLLHPLSGRSDEAVRHGFADAGAARRRLAAATAAIACGAALAYFTITGSGGTPVVVLFGAPFVWGFAEVVRSTRYLRRRASPDSDRAVPIPPPAVTFHDQVQVIDGLLERRRISVESHAMARAKLARRYHVDLGDQPGSA